MIDYSYTRNFLNDFKSIALLAAAMLCISSPCAAQAEKTGQLPADRTAADSILEKTWLVDSIFVDRTVDGVAVGKNCAGDTVNTFHRHPKKIIIEPDRKITFEYGNGTKKSGTFSLKDNRINVLYPTHNAEYDISITDEGIIFTRKVHYVIDGVQRVDERHVYKARTEKQNK